MDTPAPAPTAGGTDFPYVTPGQYADQTGTPLWTVYRRIRAGRIPALPLGRNYLLDPSTLDATAS